MLLLVLPDRRTHTHIHIHWQPTAQIWKQNCKFRELFVYLLFWQHTIFGCFTVALILFKFFIFFKLLGLTMGRRMCWCGSESKSKVVFPTSLSIALFGSRRSANCFCYFVFGFFAILLLPRLLTFMPTNFGGKSFPRTVSHALEKNIQTATKNNTQL